ncbi:E3 ubiquitin-protein ligase Su(dx) [Echinococcus granulosus]|uniref:HECT-type E3 ubiquitin transferase n=1 Tax=Echinococcus granulosus TaxID=6210 RepID=W6UI40_ECHGR|nr:E3 ubiquitin-protein ligase Su(dx) [Echinococcus granulosus]EUB60756.1 E3 ubiquitin-protein ligase Su(dx) [Echinococcus granulosus]
MNGDRSLGSLGVPVQYERNFRAKLAYFRAQCSSHFLIGHARLSISRDGLLEESFQQIQRLPASDLRKRLCITFLGEEGLDYGGIASVMRCRNVTAFTYTVNGAPA